tara:strand:- start:379 stop:645 length:267 start_codon:yes stop_codon:yes gene_type:complete
MTDKDIEAGIISDVLVSMGMAMIGQGCPDSTRMRYGDMTLGDWKKMVRMTKKEEKYLKKRYKEDTAMYSEARLTNYQEGHPLFKKDSQ